MFTVPIPPNQTQKTLLQGATSSMQQQQQQMSQSSNSTNNQAGLSQILSVQPVVVSTPEKSKRTKPKIRWSSKEHRATMRKAVEDVLINGNTTKVAQRFNIPARTLRRYVAKEKQRREAGATSLFDNTKSETNTRTGAMNIPGSDRKTQARPLKIVRVVCCCRRRNFVGLCVCFISSSS